MTFILQPLGWWFWTLQQQQLYSPLNWSKKVGNHLPHINKWRKEKCTTPSLSHTTISAKILLCLSHQVGLIDKAKCGKCHSFPMPHTRQKFCFHIVMQRAVSIEVMRWGLKEFTGKYGKDHATLSKGILTKQHNLQGQLPLLLSNILNLSSWGMYLVGWVLVSSHGHLFLWVSGLNFPPCTKT